MGVLGISKAVFDIVSVVAIIVAGFGSDVDCSDVVVIVVVLVVDFVLLLLLFLFVFDFVPISFSSKLLYLCI